VTAAAISPDERRVSDRYELQILLDLPELDGLGLLYEGAVQDLSGMVADIRRRLLDTDFAKLTAYGLDASAWLAGMEQISSRLMDDVFRLEQLATELRRRLVQASQDQPGGLGPYAAALPDLWWWRSHALAKHQPAPPRSPVSSTAAGAVAGAASPLGAASPVGAAGLAVSGDIRQRIATTAEEWVGIPYLWGGGHGAVVGVRGVNVDCSGLVHQVFGENGINLGGNGVTMFGDGVAVPDLAHALPGDLLFWGVPTIHHVAIYIGGGKMVEAPHTGAWVHVTDVRGGDFAGIRRVLP
jgi:cell wall-associated NlpC family hydrolase